MKKGFKRLSLIFALVMLSSVFSISVNAALGTKYSFTNSNYSKGTYSAVTITENINGGYLNGNREIRFEQVYVAASVSVTVKDKNGNIKTYPNLVNGGKFGVPAGPNVVTFKCNLPKNLPYYLHTTTQWFLHYSKWYWK